MQERKKKRLFKLQLNLTWRQLNGKEEDIKGEFTNEHMYKAYICMREWLIWLRTLKHLVIHALILKTSTREQRKWLMGKQLMYSHYK